MCFQFSLDLKRDVVQSNRQIRIDLIKLNGKEN